MALNHNFLPTTSLVFGVRDYLPQLEANQKQDRQGLQNAFKFLTQAHDYMQSRKQADLMEQDSKDKKNAEADLQKDMDKLAELETMLQALGG